MPFPYARRALKPVIGQSASDPMLAWIYCETVKVLRHKGILAPLRQYTNQPELFAEALADVRCGQLLTRMSEMLPVTDAEPNETGLVNKLFPAARSFKHTVAATLHRWRSRSRPAGKKCKK